MINSYFKNISVPYEILVDSGADFCIFDAKIADIINLPIKKGKKKQFSGITGGKAFMYMCPVEIKIGGWGLTHLSPQN